MQCLASKTDIDRLESKLDRLFDKDAMQDKRLDNAMICLNCQKEIPGNKSIGTAHRNHCPYCLFSKHLDFKIPGDRKSGCLGLMKPVGLTFKRDGEIMLVHKCQKCGHISKNRIAGDDDVQEILKIEDSAEIRTALFGKPKYS